MSEITSKPSPLYASLPTIYDHHDQLWAGTPAHFLEHLSNDFDYRADDVWLSSYPRSGTAWTYEVLYAVLYEGDIAALQHAQSEGKVLKFFPIEIGSAAGVAERLTTWKALPSPRVIPTHVPFRLYPKTVLERHSKRVYVVRNPKDVAVSFYHHHRSHKVLGQYQGTWDDFFECFLNGQVVYGSWFDHTLGWWANSQESPGHVLVLHYEDMQQDLATPIRRLGTFLGRPLSPQAVAAIADYASFASMSANPFTNRAGNPMMDFSIARFLRKGVVGDWKNSLHGRARRPLSGGMGTEDGRDCTVSVFRNVGSKTIRPRQSPSSEEPTMPALTEFVELNRRGRVAVITVNNPPNNVLSHGVRKGLKDGVVAASGDPAVNAMVITCAGRTFIAGGDTTEFVRPPQEPGLHEVLDLIEGSSKPVVAAIHGTALLGGLEVILACHYRVSVRTARFGLPGVTMGLLPGASASGVLPPVAPRRCPSAGTPRLEYARTSLARAVAPPGAHRLIG